ncbi:hypothetical protein PGIGA_G00093870 [Pangasianodon gigas]|uniref:Uncharacterized protein n=1 Tax=Pangasianodon gigas TaxID=30993 RepID=A0ACC5XCJ1_PANGG|nr:hypothetical protein [Pangasianodon gigas]
MPGLPVMLPEKALDCQGQRGRTIPVAALEQWQKKASGWWVGGRNRWHAWWSPLCRSSSQLPTCDGIISIATRSNDSFSIRADTKHTALSQ